MKEKVELNKNYRTRNGCVAVIINDDLPGMRPVAATILTEGADSKDAMCFGASHTRYYTPFGFEHQPIGDAPQEESPFDLVEAVGPKS